MVGKIEAVEAEAANQLDVLGKIDLILHEGAGDAGLQVVVGVGGALAERHRRADSRVIERRQHRRGRVVEEAGVAEVVGLLPANVGAEQRRVAENPCGCRHDDVSLVEHVGALGAVVVGGDRHLTPVRAGRPRNKILIEAVVVTDQGTVPQDGTADAVLDIHGAEVDVRFHVAVALVAEHRRKDRKEHHRPAGPGTR